MEVKVLVDDEKISNDFHEEHGLSIYIETKRHKILFDTGQSGLFLQNASKLEVDISKIDIVIISHGHYDHGGGLSTFMKHNGNAKIYINENAFTHRLMHGEKYIGLDKSLLQSGRFIFTRGVVQLDDELTLFGSTDIKRSCKTYNMNLDMIVNGNIVPDNFSHEQYLVINEDGKKTLFSGCSHNGILNIMQYFQNVSTVVGGFHLKSIPIDENGKKSVIAVANELNMYPAEYLTCHCTGMEQYGILKTILADKLHYIASGKTVKI